MMRGLTDLKKKMLDRRLEEKHREARETKRMEEEFF